MKQRDNETDHFVKKGKKSDKWNTYTAFGRKQ